MAVKRVLKYGNPILRMKAKPIETADESIRELAANMIDTMLDNEGIGLAAPQVGQSVSMFVVDMGLIQEDGEPMAVINPEIIEKKGQVSFEEGCLCIPNVRAEVKRPEVISLRYQDIEGNKYEEKIEGLKARVFQHEIDHLHGVLFVDRLGPMKWKLIQKQLKKIAEEETWESEV